MSKTLYLLDGMALAYRAHFALMRSPIYTSAGVNTSALYGFINTLVDLLTQRKPTHLAVVFDTDVPTFRHTEFPAYKGQRDEMPEDLSVALPIIRQVCAAMRIPVITFDGWEADDIIGTLACRAEKEGGFTTFMVTPDKDFGQLVDANTFIYRPGTAGSGYETWGVKEVCEKWGVQRPEQVIDVLGLWGDASDNIPGVPGIGEKTAKTLIEKFGSVEGVLGNLDQLKGKQKENLAAFADQARLCRRLATIAVDVPVEISLDDLAVKPFDDDAVKGLFVQFEFNSLGRRLFGDAFKAGRGGMALDRSAAPKSTAPAPADGGEPDLFSFAAAQEAEIAAAGGSPAPEPVPATLRTIKDVPHEYRMASTAAERADLLSELSRQASFCFDVETSSLDESTADLVGLAFSWQPQTGWFVPIPAGPEGRSVLEEFRAVLQNPNAEKVGHNLKFDLKVLSWHGLEVAGPFFDTMLAHALVEPDQRHGMDYLSEVYLAYTPIPITALIGEKAKGRRAEAPPPDLFAINLTMLDVARDNLPRIAEYAAEDADVTWQLAGKLRPLLESRGLHRVFYDIEAPLLPVLADLECTGVLLDIPALKAMSQQLAKQIADLEKEIQTLAGTPFNLNSPKQLGEVLFDRLKLIEKPKKTKTGQYQTSEETLAELAPKHAIVAKILEFREATKLKGTYVDALPSQVSPRSGRVHTTFLQLLAATGRLSSNNPNLQNIPIRTQQGREIRKAFIAREGWEVFSADYSQIELRVMAALSGDAAMKEAFVQGHDIHAATASRVYGVPMDQLIPDMRRTAKMVNFGIIYGISAFGLAQRLGIGREEARSIIANYFKQYPAVKAFMDRTIAEARKNGYVETMTGRRRFLRDIASANATIRGAAERTAINTPIQGTAADMIKLAMVHIAAWLRSGKRESRMLLQVHDELVFEVPPAEKDIVASEIPRLMREALPLPGVPIVVDCGFGPHWLAAH